MNKIKNIVLSILNLRAFSRMEFGNSQSIKKKRSYKNLRKGFLSISSIYYDFPNNDKSEYLSDWSRLKKASKINDQKRIVLDDKLVFHQINEKNEHVKPIVALTRKNKLYRIKNDIFTQIENREEFVNFVKQYGHGLIIKPYSGGGGSRISKVIYTNDNLFFSGSCQSYDDFKSLVISNEADFLITEIINQTGPLHDIYPYTLNTIRILTMFDENSNEPFIAKAVQRIGTSKSNVVDNFTAGGISANINIQTGEIGRGAHCPMGDKLIWYTIHPDTGVKFEGLEIKNWNVIKEYILNLSKQYFYVPYIGWDVVPMQNGFMILEGNSNSDVNLLQIHGGLLKDVRVKEFYEKYVVI